MIMTWCRSSSVFTDMALGGRPGLALAAPPPPPPLGECCGPARAAAPTPQTTARGGAAGPNVRGPRAAAADWPARRPAGRRLPHGRSIRILRRAQLLCCSSGPAAPIGGAGAAGAPWHWPASVFWLLRVGGWLRATSEGGAWNADWPTAGRFERNSKALIAR